MRLLVCIACVVVCSAQELRPCAHPKQWQGKRLRVSKDRPYREQGSIVYDEGNQRIRTIDTVEPGTQQDFYDTLYLHNVGRVYRINLRTRQCNVTKPMRPFQLIGVPPTANFLMEGIVGIVSVPTESLTTTIFDGTFSGGARYIVQVTYPDCIPVSVAVYGNTTNAFFHESYFDVELGISDPSIFVPPGECV